MLGLNKCLLYLFKFIVFNIICFKRPCLHLVITGYSTERSEQYQQDEQRTATLDLRGRRQGSLPLLDMANNDDGTGRFGSDTDRCSRTSGGDYTVDHVSCSAVRAPSLLEPAC